MKRILQAVDQRQATFAAHPFFRRLSAAYTRWPVSGLQFFSGQHLEVEQAHELFERRMRAFLESKTLSDTDLAITPAH
jgi:hypothetical protein